MKPDRARSVPLSYRAGTVSLGVGPTQHLGTAREGHGPCRAWPPTGLYYSIGPVPGPVARGRCCSSAVVEEERNKTCRCRTSSKKKHITAAIQIGDLLLQNRGKQIREVPHEISGDSELLSVLKVERLVIDWLACGSDRIGLLEDRI